LVALGLMSILVLAVMSLQSNQTKEVKALSEQLGILDLQKTVTAAMATGEVCKYVLNNPAVMTFDSTQVSLSTPQVVNLGGSPLYSSVKYDGTTYNLGSVIAKVGEAVSAYSKSLVVSAIKLSIDGAPNPLPPPGAGVVFTGNWQIEFDSQKLVRPLKPISASVLLTVDTTDPSHAKVTDCMTSGSAGSNQGIGYGQTWQDVKSSRAINTDYTNNSGKPIMVSITHHFNDYVHTEIYVDSVLVARSYNDRFAGYRNMSVIVPINSVYKVTSNAGILVWSELR
jgi:hypothetical protein